MSHAAFSLKTKAELKQVSALDLNLYIVELRKRAGWLQGAARKDIEQHLEQALKERDARRAGA